MRTALIVCLATIATGCSSGSSQPPTSSREQEIKRQEELNVREEKAQKEQQRLAQARASFPTAPSTSAEPPKKTVLLERKPTPTPVFQGLFAPPAKKAPAQLAKEKREKAEKKARNEIKKLEGELDSVAKKIAALTTEADGTTSKDGHGNLRFSIKAFVQARDRSGDEYSYYLEEIALQKKYWSGENSEIFVRVYQKRIWKLEEEFPKIAWRLHDQLKSLCREKSRVQKKLNEATERLKKL